MRAQRRELTRDEHLAAVAKPKPRFRELPLGASGVVRLRGRVPAPCFWFERDCLVGEDDRYFMESPGQGVITLFVDGVPSVLFYLADSRIESCMFAYNLSRPQLAKAVTAMKRAKMATLIAVAASHTLENMSAAQRAVLQSDLIALAPRPKRLVRGRQP